MSVFREYRSLPGPIWAMAVARMVNAVGSFVYPFLTLLLTDKLKFDKGTAGRILMIATVMFVPGSLIGGWLADRVGRKRLL
ncbi:MAG: MFS transporter, partial [Spirochaetaceae bacterium]|nr:MFS transporter [Spirochaetaceae bacterium]